jgi:hypothetical protein
MERMRLAPAIALLAIGITLPVCAQHGGGHGGFGAASRGGFSGRSSAPARAASAPRFSGNARPGPAPAARMRYSGGATGRGYDRDSRGRRRPYRPGFGYGVSPWIGPAYGSYGWAAPDYSGAPDDGGSDSASAYPDYTSQGYAAQGYNGPPAEQKPAPETMDAVTLVFKDGRPAEQIHNYILTRTTLSILDQHHRVIPVAELDLAATQKANHDSGVEFKLPDASR